VKLSLRDLPTSQKRFKKFEIPWSYIQDAAKYDVINEVDKINGPLLFIAGEEDDLITPSNVKKIYDRAIKPRKFVMLRGIGHNYRYKKSEIIKVNEAVLKFLLPTIKS